MKNNLLTSTQDDNILYAKIRDGISLSDKRKQPYFLGFLNLAEISSSISCLKNQYFENYLLWGGYENAERMMLGIFPYHLDAENSTFPISTLIFKYRKADKLSHRDFLGTLMSIGIKREIIGDILVEDGTTVVFMQTEMLTYVCQEIQKVGGVGVTISTEQPLYLPLGRGEDILQGTISSDRLDCLISAITKKSRAISQQYISSGVVIKNNLVTQNNSEQVKVDDTISVRGFGKYKIDSFSFTKKGKLSFKVKKYK